MAEKTNSNTADRELLIARVMNAPRELVWTVFTEPDHIRQWWGPTGFTNTIDAMDVRPGGIWEFVMHGPDGRDYKNKNVFREVVKPERIVFDHVSPPPHVTTITFAAEGKKTVITWHMVFESKEQFDYVVQTFKADSGLKQNLDRLENYLDQL